MWFKIISLALGLSLITKGLIGIIFHDKFYNWDHAQYSHNKPGIIVIMFLLYGLALAGTTLYATLFHYVEYGWVITLVATVMILKIYQIILNWRNFSEIARRFISEKKINTWILDICILITGLFFSLLSFTIYASNKI